MNKKLLYGSPEMIVLHLENKEDVIRTSQGVSSDNEDEWTGFY